MELKCLTCGKVENKDNYSRFSLYVYHDWGNLMFWKKINAAHFTFFNLYVETNSYMSYFTMEFSILGIHLDFSINRLNIYTCNDCIEKSFLKILNEK